MNKNFDWFGWVFVIVIVILSAIILYLMYGPPGRDAAKHINDVHVCGTIEQPDSQIQGRVHVKEFKSRLDQDGLVLSVSNSQSEVGTTIRLRICE